MHIVRKIEIILEIISMLVKKRGINHFQFTVRDLTYITYFIEISVVRDF